MAATATVFVLAGDTHVRHQMTKAAGAAGLQTEWYRTERDFLTHLDRSRAACIILDTDTPDADVAAVLRKLASHPMHVPAIVLSRGGDIQTVVRVMKAGATDVVEKPLDVVRVLDRIHRVVVQERQMHRALAERNAIADRWETLTQRERQVLRLVVAGMSNKLIASRLGISHKTVEVHRANVMRKMDATSLSDLVRYAVEMGPIRRAR